MNWPRLAGILLLVTALAGPALAEMPPIPTLPSDQPASRIPVPAPAPGVSLPRVQLPQAPLLDVNRILEGLLGNYPQIFGDFDAKGRTGMQGANPVDLLTKVLERVREVDPKGGLDSSPAGRITPELLEEGLAILRSLGTSVSRGDVQRGRLDPSLQGALGKFIPAGALGALQELNLQPDQVRRFQDVLVEMAPKIMSGSAADLQKLEGPLKERLNSILTPQQRERLRQAERQLRESGPAR